jgi:uncharacterized membrane protein (UPF0127 family)
MPSFLSPLLHGSADDFRLENSRNQAIVADHLLTAFDSASRNTGLLRHQSLAEGDALIIAPTNAIHTFFMQFAIDVVFANREGFVMKVCQAVRPWRLAAAWRAYAVIELAAGSLDRSATARGDRLVVVAR